MSLKPAATYVVEGMTCGHCLATVNEGVANVDGVSDAVADLSTGRLEVMGEAFSDDEVREAVEGAGYRVARRV